MPDKSKDNRTPPSASEDEKTPTKEGAESGEGAAIDQALSHLGDTIAADRAFARDARVAISAVEEDESDESDEVLQTKDPGRTK